MEEEMVSVVGSEENNTEDPVFVAMETEVNGIDCSRNEEIRRFTLEQGEGSNVVFSREGPLVRNDSRLSSGCCCSVKKLESRVIATDSEVGKNEKSGDEKKLSKQDRIELGRLFQGAVSSHDWDDAERLIELADPQTLNDALCMTLDSIWFLNTQQELHGITGLIKNIIANGAYDFTRAALRTSFLASCVSACQSRTMSLADTVTVMAQR